MVQINLDIKEIYRSLCPTCKKRLESMVKNKLAANLAKTILQGEEKDAPGKDN